MIIGAAAVLLAGGAILVTTSNRGGDVVLGLAMANVEAMAQNEDATSLHQQLRTSFST